MEKNKVNILVSACLGENLGDEVIFHNFHSFLTKKIKNVEFFVFSSKPNVTSKMHNVESFYHLTQFMNYFKSPKKIIDILRIFKKTDIIIIGGGGIFQDVHSPETIPRYSIPVLIAKVFRKPVFCYSVGVGPIKNAYLKKLVKLIFEQVDSITVRDKYSKRFLMDLGVSKEVFLAPDPAILSSILHNRKKLSKDLKNKIVAICIRKFKLSKIAILEISKFCDYLIEKKSFKIIFVPMETDDIEVIGKVIQNIRNKHGVLVMPKDREKMPISQFIEFFGNISFAVSMRLHGLIIPVSYDKPVIGLVYDEKVRNFMKSIDNENFIVDIDKITFDILERMYRRLEFEARINSRVESLQRRSLEALDHVVSSIGIKPKFNTKEFIFSWTILFLILINFYFQQFLKRHLHLFFK